MSMTKKVKLIAGAIFISLFLIAGAVLIVIGSYKYIDNSRKSIALEAFKQVESGNYARAAYLFDAAFKDGDKLSGEYLAWLYCRLGNYKAALKATEESIKVGNFDSFEILGILALIGQGPVIGSDIALRHFYTVLKSKEEFLDSTAQSHKLAQMLDEAIYSARNKEDFIKLVKVGVDINAPLCLMAMGDLFYLGDSVDKSELLALDYWKKAQRLGVAAAANRLGGAYYHGIGTIKDVSIAVDFYKQGVKAKDPVAMYNLALVLLKSQDLEQIELARKLLERASDLNYIQANFLLGFVILSLGSDEPNYQEKAIYYFKKAYDAQEPIGGAFYALMSKTGRTATKDEYGYDPFDFVYQIKAQGSLIGNTIIESIDRGISPDVILDSFISHIQSALFYDHYNRVSNEKGISIDGDQALANAKAKSDENYRSEFLDDNTYDEELEEEQEKEALMKKSKYLTVYNSDLYINGNLIYIPGIGSMLVQISPGTSVRHFVPTTEPPKPNPPYIPPEYRDTQLTLPEGF